MKTFKDIINEVAQPKGGDEKDFKAKHVIQKINHTPADEKQFTAPNVKKDKSKLSGYKDGEDKEVYEESDGGEMCSECQEMYEDCGCEDKKDKKETAMYASYMKRRSSAVKSMKESKDDLQSRYGDKWKSVMYANATRNAMEAVNLDEISPEMKARYAKKANTSLKRATTTRDNATQRASDASERIQKAYDRNRSAETAYRDQDRAATQAANQKKVMAKRTAGLKRANEGVEHVRQALKAGEMKLSDGTTAKMSKEDVSALDTLFKELTTANQTKMHDRMMKDKKSFAEIVSFAKESL